MPLDAPIAATCRNLFTLGDALIAMLIRLSKKRAAMPRRARFGVATARVAMALSAKLAMRQGQTMVLTPQLLQAIKLLQMPNAELAAFIENELERNPLLERAEDERRDRTRSSDADAPAAEVGRRPATGRAKALEADPAALARNLGTEIENAFDARPRRDPAERPPATTARACPATSWSGRRRRRRRRASARPRGLCRRDRVAERAS